MPALQQHVGHPQRLQRGQAGAHAGFIDGLCDAQQPGGFLQVGGQQAHLRQQHRADPLQVAFIHQALVCAGRHHGVKYHEGWAMTGQHLGNRLGNPGIGHHADLHGGHRHVLEHGFQLRLHQLRRQRRDHAHRLRVLRHHGRHHRHAIGTQRPEGLQVGLDASPAGRIGAGDGKRVGGDGGRRAGRGGRGRGGGHGGMSGKKKETREEERKTREEERKTRAERRTCGVAPSSAMRRQGQGMKGAQPAGPQGYPDDALSAGILKDRVVGFRSSRIPTG